MKTHQIIIMLRTRENARKCDRFLGSNGRSHWALISFVIIFFPSSMIHFEIVHQTFPTNRKQIMKKKIQLVKYKMQKSMRFFRCNFFRNIVSSWQFRQQFNRTIMLIWSKYRCAPVSLFNDCEHTLFTLHVRDAVCTKSVPFGFWLYQFSACTMYYMCASFIIPFIFCNWNQAKKWHTFCGWKDKKKRTHRMILVEKK